MPGLIYLTALNAIAAGSRGTLSELVQVGIYNVIWFSLAIVALAMSVRRPDTASQLLEQLGRWGRQHHRAIMVGFFGVLGGYLLVVGIRGLLQHLT